MNKTITERRITPSIKEKASFLGFIRESFSLKKGKELIKTAWTINLKQTPHNYTFPEIEKRALQSRSEVEFRIAQAYATCIEQTKIR